MSDLEDVPRPGLTLAAVRLGVGLAQGLALYALSEAATRHVWPDTRPALFAAMVFATGFAPVVVLAGVGRMRPLVLGALAIIMAAAAAWFGWHGVAREFALVQGVSHPPNPVFFLVAAGFVFVGHHLAQPADVARRWIAPYPTYFDTAWKNAVQLALSLGFVGVLWLGLLLGAALFSLIGVKTFMHLIEKRWFMAPVTTTAFAAAVQLTDVRVALIRGVRTVGLMLLAWLGPLMTVIAVAFLAALPFTGLAPLFATRSAAVTLLAATAGLIVLINAAYREGGTEAAHVILRHSTRVAAVCLAPLVAIAGFALSLRVGQYGWTPDRIEASAACVIGAGYALGYAAATLPMLGSWMKLIERVNVAMAVVVMAVAVALFTPIADPARLSVDDQVGRLLRGATAPDKFDYAFLKTGAGRYGRAALDRLKTLATRADIAHRAQEADQVVVTRGEDVAPAQTTFTDRVAVFPVGAALPKSFADFANGTHTDLRPGSQLSFCLPPNTARCEAYVLDVDGDRTPEVLIVEKSGAGAVNLQLEVYRDTPRGWRDVGDLTVICPAAVQALRRGEVKLEPDRSPRIVIAGRGARLSPREDAGCPALPAPQGPEARD